MEELQALGRRHAALQAVRRGRPQRDTAGEPPDEAALSETLLALADAFGHAELPRRLRLLRGAGAAQDGRFRQIYAALCSCLAVLWSTRAA
jgi:hypothetical protein